METELSVQAELNKLLADVHSDSDEERELGDVPDLEKHSILVGHGLRAKWTSVFLVALAYGVMHMDNWVIAYANIVNSQPPAPPLTPEFELIWLAVRIAKCSSMGLVLLWDLSNVRTYVLCACLLTGLATALQAAALPFPAFMIVRVCIGVGQGMLTGGLVYLTFDWPRDQLGLMIGVVACSIPFSTAVSTWTLESIIGLGAQEKMIYFLHALSIWALGYSFWKSLPGPSETSVSSPRSKSDVLDPPMLIKRALRRGSEITTGLVLVAVDLKVICSMLMCLFARFALASNLFFANEENQMQFTYESYYFIMASYETAERSFAVSELTLAFPLLLAIPAISVTAWLSDRMRCRSFFIVLLALLCSSGFTIMSLSRTQEWSAWWQYASIFPTCIGFHSLINLIVTWTIDNQDTNLNKSIAFIFIEVSSQIGFLLGPAAVRPWFKDDAPLYTSSLFASALLCIAVALLAWVKSYYLVNSNIEQHRWQRTVTMNQQGDGNAKLVS